MKNKKLWFKAKMYGWGWQPVSWEGWVVTLIYVAAITLIFLDVGNVAHSGNKAVFTLVVRLIINTIFLLIICYARGEKPRWRWGK